MPKFFIGRQPIFDCHLRVFAYELLYRHADIDQAVITDGEKASAEVLFNSLIEIGLERLVGNHKAFCNFTRDFLIKGDNVAFANKQLVIEVLETVIAEPRVLDGIRGLTRMGHLIALDDFVISDKLLPLVKMADIIKIDVKTQSRNNIAKQLCCLNQIKPLTFIAEKVETYDDFIACRELGFDYFQGYFFSKPKIVSGQRMPPARMALLRLLAELQQSDIDIEKLQKIIETDINLSVKLLRLINSSFYSLASKIRSIRQAIVYLGLQNIRNWACLVAMGSVDDKPRELMTMSLVRAKMCELLCDTEKTDARGMFFTVGLFSLLDTLFDTKMEKLLKHLPLTEEVNRALLHREGLPGRVLCCVEAHEKGDWDFVEKTAFDINLIVDAYLEALDWARSI